MEYLNQRLIDLSSDQNVPCNQIAMNHLHLGKMGEKILCSPFTPSDLCTDSYPRQ